MLAQLSYAGGIMKEIIRWYDASMRYLTADNNWVNLVHCVPKKGGMIMVINKKGSVYFNKASTRMANLYGL